MSATAPPLPHPRTFTSSGEAVSDVAGVLRRARPLAGVYLGRQLDRELRERVMVAVSRVNACRGCTRVHERWAIHAGVSAEEVAAIGLGDMAPLDDRSRVAVVYAAALAERRFRSPPPRAIAIAAAEHLSKGEIAAVEAVARAMALANLSVSTTEAVCGRLRLRG